MKALLVYPEHPSLTYWSYRGALPYVERRAAFPPLGLITVAALLPAHWRLRLIDRNVEPLRDADLIEADVVLVSAMKVQEASLRDLVARCNRLGVPIVAGGPYPSASPHRMTGVDHVVVGEAEGVLAEFADEFERGRAKPLYRAAGFPDIDSSPVPRFDLLDLDAYASMSVQHSRGCPFSCEFCDIWQLYGRRSRVKPPERMTAELDALHDTGWRGPVFFVDDNFIGNRRLAKDSLAAIERWQRAHGFPFGFYTEASVNLGSDEELMAGMREAGFSLVFLGIESPSIASLEGTGKAVNANLDLLAAVRRIQEHGLEVSGGFIVGFDDDTDDIFDRQIAFIREAGIPLAMVGLLTAIEGTALYERLVREGRLLDESAGNNTHAFEPNFIPRMPAEQLAEGYRRVIRTLYDPALRDYFERCRCLLDRLGPNPNYTRRIVARELRAFVRSLATIPLRRYGREYLRFLVWASRRHPSRFPEAVRLAIQGFHLEGITREALACDAIRRDSKRLIDRMRNRIAVLTDEARSSVESEAQIARGLLADRARGLRELRLRIGRLGPEARASAASAYLEAVERINASIARYRPAAADARVAGLARLASARAAFHAEVERYRARHREAIERVGRGAAELQSELRRLARARRDALARARRQLRGLPREYRPLAGLELLRLRRSIDEI